MNLQRRYLRSVVVQAPLALKPGQPIEVSFPVDSEVLGLFSSESLEIAFSAPLPSADPRATAAVARLVWLVKDGEEIPHGAQASDMVATISQGDGKLAFFVETEKQALARLSAARR